MYHQSHEHDAEEAFKTIEVFKAPEYLNELVYGLYFYIDSILRGSAYIYDSTGCMCDRHVTKDAAMKKTRVRQTVKLHIGVKYYHSMA